MADEYLWNRTGETDPEVANLEKLLAPLAYRPKPRWWQRRFVIPALAAAAMVAIGIFVWARPGVATDWSVSIAAAEPRAVRRGEVIDTGRATASLKSSLVGQMTVEPGSRLKLIDAGVERQHFSLEHGTIRALIWAPPARFAVDTPSARAIDLGCQYTLRVDRNGSGLLAVQLGWVAFEAGGKESFIPAGAECRTNRKSGPGIPYFSDAPEGLKTALANFDGGSGEVGSILGAAREHDALTLWHLLSRTKGGDRDRVYQRMAQLVKLPPIASEAAIQRGDRAALDAAWDALQLGGTDWWRTWKRDW